SGTVTPAIRSIKRLSLALFVARIFTDNPKSTATLHGTTIHTNFFDRCFYFHFRFSLDSSRDTCTPAIRIELECHSIAHEHFDSMQTHFAGKVRENKLAVSKLYAKKSIG